MEFVYKKAYRLFKKKQCGAPLKIHNRPYNPNNSLAVQDGGAVSVLV